MNAFDCVATYHTNPWTCGVTRWNQRLAQELGVPLVPLLSPQFWKYDAPLVSIKRSECDVDVEAWRRVDKYRDWLEHMDQGLCRWNPYLEGRAFLWCPGTIPVYRRQETAPYVLSMVCFGMSHKIQARRFRKLADLCRDDHRGVSLSVSTAIHEGTSLDAQFTAAYEDISAIFDGQTQFLGWLADAALGTVLSQASVFAAFFPEGVRANNTTVMSALAAGCPVITNVDEQSPEGFVHGETVLDIRQCERIPPHEELEAIGKRGQVMVNERYSWEKLVEVLCA